MSNRRLQNIIHGYMDVLRNVFRVAFFSVIIAAAGISISFPLWFWATRSRKSFNVFVLAVLSALLFLLLIRSVHHSVLNSISGGTPPRSAALQPILKVGRVLLTLMLIYTALYLFAAHSLLLSAPFAICAILLIGLINFPPKSR